MLCFACLHVEAVFEFTKGVYGSIEETGVAVVTVRIAPSSGVLGYPVQICVQTLSDVGNAAGEYRAHDITR